MADSEREPRPGPTGWGSVTAWERYLLPIPEDEWFCDDPAFASVPAAQMAMKRIRFAAGKEETRLVFDVLKDIIDRTDGKPTQSIDHSGEVGLKILDLDV